DAVDGGAPARGARQGAENPQQGGLARAVRPCQRDHLSCADQERDPLQRLFKAKRFFELQSFNHRQSTIAKRSAVVLEQLRFQRRARGGIFALFHFPCFERVVQLAERLELRQASAHLARLVLRGAAAIDRECEQRQRTQAPRDQQDGLQRARIVHAGQVGQLDAKRRTRSLRRRRVNQVFLS